MAQQRILAAGRQGGLHLNQLTGQRVEKNTEMQDRDAIMWIRDEATGQQQLMQHKRPTRPDKSRRSQVLMPGTTWILQNKVAFP